MNTTGITGSRLHFFEELASTNSYALKLLQGPQPEEGTVIQTHFQTKGKGQSNTQWQVQAGQNLTLSVIYYPSFLSISHLFYLSKACSLAVFHTIHTFLKESPLAIKWPNDILLSKQKIAGILIENQLMGNAIGSTVVGIGINVNQLDFPKNFTTSATSLAIQTGKTHSLEAIRSILFQQLDTYYFKLKAAQYASIDHEYYQHLYGYQNGSSWK